MCTCAYNPSIEMGAETGFPELTGRRASPVDVIAPVRDPALKNMVQSNRGKHPRRPLDSALSCGHTLHSHGPARAQSASPEVIWPLRVSGAFSSGGTRGNIGACFTLPTHPRRSSCSLDLACSFPIPPSVPSLSLLC